ncbi:MAG TPA: glucose-1-phosphate cytidylyltransferase [Terriglobales bacterium]|nr:glucose-1-phosphate cytidylyltransferase [Terriglobales bacterium]
MKVVLFCGGLGTRLREYSEVLPKPMVNIGYRPILWHVMKYYAHFGHKEFILCLGYKGDAIKHYFLNYDECVSNNFVLRNGGKDIKLLNSDIDDWNITFVDTGINSNIGQRLAAVRDYIGEDEEFMANYSDGLSDLPMPKYIDHFEKRGNIASFVSVVPTQSFHVLKLDGERVCEISHIRQSGMRINGGFFLFKRQIFDYIREGEELVEQPFQRLIAANQLYAYNYDGFWACMDTFKDKQMLDDMYAKDDAPWEVWKPVRKRKVGVA